jgi:hypothetical protein
MITKIKTINTLVEVDIPDCQNCTANNATALEKEIDFFETTGNDPVAVKWLKYASEVIKRERVTF